MVLNRDSKFIKWVFRHPVDDYSLVPESISLCKLFWMTVFALTLKPLLVGFFYLMAFTVMPIIWAVGKLPKTKTQQMRAMGERYNTLYWRLEEEWYDEWRVTGKQPSWNTNEELIRRFPELKEYIDWINTTPSPSMFSKIMDWPVWGILYNGAVAIKSKVCPIVRFQ